MKVLSPAVTCFVTSHMKPYLRDTLNSLLSQERRDFEAIVLDSGQWIGQDDVRSKEMASIHAEFAGHPLVRWLTTGELPGLAARSCPSAWVLNRAFRLGLARGYACVISDDDVYQPEFMSKMAGYLDAHPEAQAVWCSLKQTYLYPDGSTSPGRPIVANRPRNGPDLDCSVDGIQVMFRAGVLDVIGDPWCEENPVSCNHADGLFLNNIGAACGSIPYVPDTLCEHRFTPLSTYTSTF
jgi:hypothetical protein